MFLIWFDNIVFFCIYINMNRLGFGSVFVELFNWFNVWLVLESKFYIFWFILMVGFGGKGFGINVW